MDQQLSKEYKQRQRLKKILIGFCTAALIMIFIISFRKLVAPGISRNLIIISVAERGNLEVTINASGIVVPEYEQVITSPVQTSILAVYHKAGEKINKGDQIIKLNKEFIELQYEKMKDELELIKTQKQKQIILLNNSRVENEADYNIQELNVKFNEAKAKRQAGLYKIGAATLESIEESNLNLQISEKEKEKLKTELSNNIELQEAELSVVDFQIRICENKLKEISRQLELADMLADKEGIITWVNENIGSTVNAGEKLVSVADLGSFQVAASISDIHATKLFIGQDVKIKLNDQWVKGVIANLNPSVLNGVISFHIRLEEKNNPMLRPNLRVEVYVVTSKKENVTKVKNGPFYNGAVNPPVFVISKDKAVRRSVYLGESNFDYVEIINGIEPGEEVIISDMNKYDNIEELEIKN